MITTSLMQGTSFPRRRVREPAAQMEPPQPRRVWPRRGTRAGSRPSWRDLSTPARSPGLRGWVTWLGGSGPSGLGGGPALSLQGNQPRCMQTHLRPGGRLTTALYLPPHFREMTKIINNNNNHCFIKTGSFPGLWLCYCFLGLRMAHVQIRIIF